MAKRKSTKSKTSPQTRKSSGGQGTAPRQVMFRPERLKYVRKIVKPVGCVFCSSRDEKNAQDSLLVAEQGTAMLILNKYPYNAGHLLVLPKRHIGNFAELTAQEAADIHALQKKALGALTDLYSPGGFNMGLNLGAVAGAGIPEHLHWHLIPRWPGDTNFFPLIAQTKVVIESLERTRERLQPYFKT